MSKTTDELEVEVIEEDLKRDGADVFFLWHAMWELGEKGNQIAYKRIREILNAAIEKRRENQGSANTPSLSDLNHSE